MKLQEELCEMYCGECVWFCEEEELPVKLKMLGHANLMLAHRPWEFGLNEIERLLTHWHLNELIEALVILSFEHALSSFVMGLGVAEEYDLPLNKNHSNSLSSPSLSARLEKLNIIEKLRNYEETMNCVLDEFFTTEEPKVYEETSPDSFFEKKAGGYLPYINYDITEFSRPVHPSDFNWRDQGYHILEKLSQRIAEKLWDTLSYTYSMTYNTLGEEDEVSTEPLRRAIWMYTQRVYGLDYDDYDYKEVNLLLPINTKQYLKKIACVPHTVTQDDYSNVDLEVSHDEHIHINLLVFGARLEAELIYILHAIHQFQLR